MHTDIEALQALGYEVKEFTPTHFRINDKLDIWPTTKFKKYHQVVSGERGGYEDIVELAERIFPPAQKLKVVHTRDVDDFEKETNQLTSQGWKIDSTSCNNDFRAILIKGGNNG